VLAFGLVGNVPSKLSFQICHAAPPFRVHPTRAMLPEVRPQARRMPNTHTSESGLSEQEVWLIRFEQ
jgi:hypothetical protein